MINFTYYQSFYPLTLLLAYFMYIPNLYYLLLKNHYSQLILLYDDIISPMKMREKIHQVLIFKILILIILYKTLINFNLILNQISYLLVNFLYDLMVLFFNHSLNFNPIFNLIYLKNMADQLYIIPKNYLKYFLIVPNNHYCKVKYSFFKNI